MSKFILIDPNNRVSHVEDTRPEDALTWTEVSNDSVQPHWWVDPSDNSLHQYKQLSIDEVRTMRDRELQRTDWMVLEDSPYKAADQSDNLTAIKTYRQALRDYPDPETSYNENNLDFPAFPVLS